MSDLSRRRGLSGSEKPTTCFCNSCDRVLYVAASALFCPVCSSPVMEVAPDDEIALSEQSETPSA